MIADGVICTGLIISNATSSIPILGTLKDALSTVLTFGFTDKLSDTASFVLGIRGVEVIYSSLLRYLPTIIVTIAGILAFLSYFLTLCKYYYISPFVVAFALTTKRVDKIINFLITGITIFFKPILIVLFIYLALFFHTVIDDIFLLFSVSQFSIIPYEITDTAAMFVVGACRALLTIFGSLASCYIVWKTIMSGPDWTFKLLGLDKDSDNVIAQGLAGKLETKAVVVV